MALNHPKICVKVPLAQLLPRLILDGQTKNLTTLLIYKDRQIGFQVKIIK